MAKNPPKRDHHRKGAIGERSQIYNPKKLTLGIA